MNIFRTASVVLAAFALTACGGGAGDGSSGAVDTGDGAVQIEASDLAFDPEQIAVSSGEVQVDLTNVGAVEHDIVIEETGDTMVVHAEPGETATGSIDLEADTYIFYCSVPGHREAGMEGTIEVR